MNANSRAGAVSFLAVVPMMLTAQVRRNSDPVVLKHWAAPLYWQPQAVEAAAASLPASANPLVFVAMTPCRVVDTRASQGFLGAFGAPSLVSGASRTFPMQSSTTCSIPAAAQAYSVNLTVVPSGPSGFITAYPTGQPLPLAATLVWSSGSITSNAAIVPGGTNGSVDVYANSLTEIVIDINGYYTAVGSVSVGSVPGQITNTALGLGALGNRTTGSTSTAIGAFALASNSTGDANTAVGENALVSATTGSGNTAVGENALANMSTGSANIAIGSFAGANLTGGNFNNIHIGSAGSAGDSGTTRIGTPGAQTSIFVAGVRGVTTGNNDAIPVVIDSSGQLGTVSSSRRFKEDIQDMGDASRGLLRLRPVTFRYPRRRLQADSVRPHC